MSWAGHRVRAAALRERYPFAAEVLGCYVALLDVWDTVAPSTVDGLVDWAAGAVLPKVVVATDLAGPEKLAAAVRDLGPAEPVFTAWLAGEELPPVESYLARACLYPALVALGDEAGAACRDDPAPRDERHCPRCGGLPQLSLRGTSGDLLVSSARQLLCVRCGHTWGFSGSACPSCGATEGGQRTLYAEQRSGPVVGPGAGVDWVEESSDSGDEASNEGGGRRRRAARVPRERTDPGVESGGALFPHMRVDACAGCQRYLIDVDLGRDRRAVPEVDELAALPLALYATDQGLSKITPNLMGL